MTFVAPTTRIAAIIKPNASEEKKLSIARMVHLERCLPPSGTGP